MADEVKTKDQIKMDPTSLGADLNDVINLIEI